MAHLVLALLMLLATTINAYAKVDPLPSWNDGPAKQAIIQFVKDTTEKRSPKYVQPEDRIATFDQDGTLWVEHPIYTQLVFALQRVVAMAPEHPDWKTTEPFKSILTDDKSAIAKFTKQDLAAILMVTHTRMPVEEFQATVKEWISKAKHPRWNVPYTDLVYQPMLEVMKYLRANGFKTYIVTGGGQAFVRVYAEQVYGVPQEQVIGTALQTRVTYDKSGKQMLMRSPKVLLNDDFNGKPQDIYLFTGRRPLIAFGNSTGDQQMLEYTAAGSGARLMMLIMHDDAVREFAYGPTESLPDTKVGTFSQALYNEAIKNNWYVVRMSKDWKNIFKEEVQYGL